MRRLSVDGLLEDYYRSIRRWDGRPIEEQEAEAVVEGLGGICPNCRKPKQ
jgi:hypothetical protein